MCVDTVRTPGMVTCVDLTTGTIQKIGPENVLIKKLALSSDNNLIATLGANITNYQGYIGPNAQFIISLFDIHTGECIKNLDVSSELINSPYCKNMLCNGKIFFITSDNKKIVFIMSTVNTTYIEPAFIIDIETGRFLTNNIETHTSTHFADGTVALGHLSLFPKRLVSLFYFYDDKLIQEALQSLSLEELLWVHASDIHARQSNLEDCKIYHMLPELLQNVIKKP